MKKLWYTFLKDMKLSLKGLYFYIEIIMAVIFIAILLIVVPENFKKNMTIYANLNMEDSYKSMAKDSLKESGDKIIILDSREEIEAKLKKNHSSVGLEVSVKDKKIVFDYILQGYENKKFRNIIETSIKSKFITLMPEYKKTTTTVTLDKKVEKLSDRINLLPVYLTLNAAFMGLFIIASYIFLDKEEGTIKAFAVSTASVWQYLASKMAVMLVSGITTAVITVIAVAGTKAHYFHLIILMIAFNAFGSALGLFIASFFDTMSKAMGWLYISVIIFGFASVSYYMPSFSPFYVKILPSYPMLFSFREVLLDEVNLKYIYSNVGIFIILTGICFYIANYRFKKTLTV